MQIKIKGEFHITPGGPVFVADGLTGEYDMEYLFRQLLKCDVYCEITHIRGVKPQLVFPFVRRIQRDGDV